MTANASALRVFVPLTKIDIEKRLVYGVATAEAEDLSGEVCDYASTKPFYEKWSEKCAKASGGKSLGNLRAMHGATAAGKVASIDFNDEARSIEICAKVVDDNEWKKVTEGVYTGFSQGGAYVKRWTDAETGLTKYTANPSEISLVDLPCLPTATFAVVKAEGVVEKRAFTSVVEEPDADAIKAEAERIADAGKPWREFVETAVVKLMKAQTAAALAKLDIPAPEAEPSDPAAEQTFVEPVQKWDCGCADHTHLAKHEAVKCMKKRAAEADAATVAAPADAALAKLEADLGIGAAGAAVKVEKAENPRVVVVDFGKGLGQVARLASIIDDLGRLYQGVSDESIREGDNSPNVPALKANIEGLSATLLSLAKEETDELFRGDGAFDYSAPDVLAMAARLPERERVALIKISERAPGLKEFAGVLEKTQGEDANRTLDRFVTEAEALVKIGARNSTADKGRLQKAHDLLCELGADCPDANDTEDDEVEKIRAENGSLKKSIDDFGARLTAIAEKVAEMGKRAAPARAAVRSVEKHEDAASIATQAADALAKMSPEERALVLMKASLAMPVSVIPR